MREHKVSLEILYKSCLKTAEFNQFQGLSTEFVNKRLKEEGLNNCTPSKTDKLYHNVIRDNGNRVKIASF